MPQFDVSNFSSQIFWLVVCFFVLYIFVSKYLLPRIRGIIDCRIGAIDRTITEIDNLKKEIAKTNQNSNAILKSNNKAVKDLIDQEQTNTEEELKQKYNEMNEKINNEIEEVRALVLSKQKAMLSDLPEITKEVFKMCVNKMMDTSFETKLWDFVKDGVRKH